MAHVLLQMDPISELAWKKAHEQRGDLVEIDARPHIGESPICYDNVKIIVGADEKTFIIPEVIFHKYIAGFEFEFSKRDYYSQEKSLILLFEDPDVVEILLKRMCGDKDVYADQYSFERARRPIHEMTCFKLFMLAAELKIWELTDEAYEKLGEALGGGKSAVTAEAVTTVYRRENDLMELLKVMLANGAMEEWFADGDARVGRREALDAEALFAKEVDIAIGHHVMKHADECALDACYFHKSEDKIVRSRCSWRRLIKVEIFEEECWDF